MSLRLAPLVAATVAIAGLLVTDADTAAVPRGTTLDVELVGSNTGFRSGSAPAVAGAGVTVAATQVLSPTRIVARLAVAPGAATGFRDVTVSTDRGDGSIETAKGIGAVQVVGAPSAPTVLSVTPSAVAVGTTRDVTISGGLTHFGPGSAAQFGAGVTVNSTTVDSPRSAVANVTVAPGATIGFRDVTVQTGGEHATESVPGFRDLKVTTGAEDASLLDGFEVRPAPAVTPTPAPTPSSSPAPGPRPGGGAAGTHSDRARPSVSFLRGKRGVRAKQGRLRLRGRARDTGCAAAISVAGRVARVDVAISRKAGRRCRFVARNGRLTAARKCSKPLFLRAKGTTSWSLATKRRLPRGSYAIQVRARDAAGNARTAKRTQRVS